MAARTWTHNGVLKYTGSGRPVNVASGGASQQGGKRKGKRKRNAKAAGPSYPIKDAQYHYDVTRNQQQTIYSPDVFEAQQWLKTWGTPEGRALYQQKVGQQNQQWDRSYASGVAGLGARGMGRSGGVDRLAGDIAMGRQEDLFGLSQGFGAPAVARHQAFINQNKWNLDRLNAASLAAARGRVFDRPAQPMMSPQGVAAPVAQAGRWKSWKSAKTGVNVRR